MMIPVTLEEAVARHRTLADAVAWGLMHTPPLVVADVVTQDEYTHDVVLPYRDGRFVVYDTT
jgi:hypothetical protein